MGILKATRGVKVLALPAKKSNLSAALQQRRTKASCTSTLAAVSAIRRPDANPHSFLLKFRELEESSATRDTETHHEQPTNKQNAFAFTGGEL